MRYHSIDTYHTDPLKGREISPLESATEGAGPPSAEQPVALSPMSGGCK